MKTKRYCSASAIVKNGSWCCAGGMTGHGVPSDSIVLGPFRVFGNKYLIPPLHGKVVKLEDYDKELLQAGFSEEYRPMREQNLYPVKSMRRSWRKAGISQETFEKFVIKHGFLGNKIQWKMPEEVKKQAMEFRAKYPQSKSK